MKPNRIATTVKVEGSLYDEFKILGIRHKLNLQNLVERTIYRYVNDETFRSEINNFFLPVYPKEVLAVSASVSSSVSASVS